MVIQLVVPEAAMVGHLTGIVSAYLLYSLGLSILLPQYSWINGFETDHEGLIKKVESWFTYYRASQR